MESGRGVEEMRNRGETLARFTKKKKKNIYSSTSGIGLG